VSIAATVRVEVEERAGAVAGRELEERRFEGGGGNWIGGRVKVRVDFRSPRLSERGTSASEEGSRRNG
jgi:hypothetical protein